jgi:hypothetical protein
LLEMCGIVGEGAQSLIEIRYVNDVERAHGPPNSRTPGATQRARAVVHSRATRQRPSSHRQSICQRTPGCRT